MVKKLLTTLISGGIIAGLYLTTGAQAEETAEQGVLLAQAGDTVPESEIYTVASDYAGKTAVLGGTVIPHVMVNILAQMPGEIEFIAGEEGDSFKKGEHLVAQDIDNLLAKREAAQAGLRSAQAGYNNALVQYERQRRNPGSQSTQANSMLGGMPSMFGMFSDPMRAMTGQGSPGYERHSNLYGQGVQVQTARDQIDQAIAGIKELDENIENAVNKAPFDGVIVKKMIQVGDVVQPGMPLLVYADTKKMQIQAEVPSRIIRSIKEGDIVTAKLDRGREVIPAVVARVFPMANVGGHTTTVKFDLPADVEAHAGMYAEVMIQDKEAQQVDRTPVIPQSAITWRGSLPAVFMVSKDKTQLKMKTIRLGSSKPNGNVTVISGISVGDKILKAPLASTRSGAYRAQPKAN